MTWSYSDRLMAGFIGVSGVGTNQFKNLKVTPLGKTEWQIFIF